MTKEIELANQAAIELTARNIVSDAIGVMQSDDYNYALIHYIRVEVNYFGNRMALAQADDVKCRVDSLKSELIKLGFAI